MQRPLERVLSKWTIENPIGSTATGTYQARVTGLHSGLLIGIYLAYVEDAGGDRGVLDTIAAGVPFGSNAFALYPANTNKEGRTMLTSATALNGSSGQSAPDGWEISSTVREVLLIHTFKGMSSSYLGHWEIIVVLQPAEPTMCEADFNRLADLVDIRAPGMVLTASGSIPK